MRLLKRLTTVLQSSEELARLRETSDEEDAMRILAAHAAERAAGSGAGDPR